MAKKPAPPQHRVLSILPDWALIHRELMEADDRAKAVVAAAYVENNLTMAILARLRHLGADGQKHLCDNDHSALNTFSAKIDIGWALDLYDIAVRGDLHRVRKIRNKFAHALDVRSFDDPAVANDCDKLIGADVLDLPRGRLGARTRRERYLHLAAHFGERFAMDSNKPQRPAPSPNRITPDY